MLHSTNHMAGFFIILEGPDGAGTTTHSRLLAERLEAEGRKVLLTAEPTDGPVGTWVRAELKKGTKLPPASLQLLFTADRAWHMENVIEPALARGETVICDRYFHSTIVYGSVQGLPSDWLKEMNTKFIQPDQVIFLLPPFDVCRERVGRRESTDEFEEESFQKKVYDGYEALAREESGITVIRSTGEKKDVSQEIFSSLH